MFAFGSFGFGYIFLAGLVGLLVILYNEKNKDKKRARAHDKVVELRKKGIESHICQKCKGKGEFGAWDRECNECGGLGYIYQEPPVEK